MAQVTVHIDGKTFRMACDEGEEARLKALAERFDTTLMELKEAFGAIGDTRLAVMAGIVMTDKLSDLERQMAGLQSELSGLRALRDQSASENDQSQQALALAIVSVSERLEQLADDMSAGTERA